MDYGRATNPYSSVYYVLETALNDILRLIKPDANDLAKRQRTVDDIRSLVGSLPGLNGASVNPFGSYICYLGTKWSDVDISIQLSEVPSSVNRRRKQKVLRDIMKALSSSGISAFNFAFVLFKNKNLAPRILQKVLQTSASLSGWGYCSFIPQARVPVLVFQSRLRDVSCDISVDNHWGLVKSKIFRLLSNLDSRFRDMARLIKEWAKANNVNNPKSGTLSSFSICLLIIFHFQTCSPAIFPPLKDIYGGNLLQDFMDGKFSSLTAVEDLCSVNIQRISHMCKRNHSSLRELFISFFQKFSGLKKRAEGLHISTYNGRYEQIRLEETYSHLIIEDPFEVPDNAGRTVDSVGLMVISRAFDDTLSQLSSRSVLSDKNAIVNLLLSSRALSHR